MVANLSFSAEIVRMHAPVQPNFFLVGTGKAGTTSLYHYLRQHPQIYMSPVKEPCYFSSEIRTGNLSPVHLRHVRRLSRKLPEVLADGQPVPPFGWLVSEWEEYVRLFGKATTEKAIGEASAAYLWSETAAHNISSRFPNAKIIMMLRDPAERAFSQYLHQLTVGLTRSTFREHIGKCMRNRDRTLGPYFPLLEVGLYHEQVQRFLSRFPRTNIRIYWYEESWGRPKELLSDLFQFLDVDSTFCPDTSHKSLQRRAPRFAATNYAVKHFEITHRLSDLAPSWVRSSISRLLFRRAAKLVMDPGDRQFLIGYYREDITKLASMLNHDLTAWLV